MSDNKETQLIVLKYTEEGGYRVLAEQLSDIVPGITFSFQAVGQWAIGKAQPDYPSMVLIHLLGGDCRAAKFAREVLAVQNEDILTFIAYWEYKQNPEVAKEMRIGEN